MRVKPKPKRKWNWINGKKDGGKISVPLLLSCFSSSSDEDFERNTKDEVLKPLYYIVGDINSELMEATVESIDDESIDRKTKVDKRFRQSQPRRVDNIFSRFLTGILNRSEKNREIKTTYVGLARRMNETERNDSVTNEQRETKEKLSLKKASAYGYRVSHILRLPILYLSSRCKKNHAPKSEHLAPSAQLEIYEQNADSDDASMLRPASLGVTFAHPAYTGKCRLLADDARLESTNLLWTKMKTDKSIETDDYTLPPTKKFVETTTAESWGSVGSSSLYPTDEQSHDDGNIYYGSFDSDIDIPFDEIFTETTFFEIYQI